jgi:hypothetical protein
VDLSLGLTRGQVLELLMVKGLSTALRVKSVNTRTIERAKNLLSQRGWFLEFMKGPYNTNS